MKLEEIKKNLTGRTAERIQPPGAKSAAVLIPLLERDGSVRVLFERRSADVRQGGEICFPGGMIEPHERPADAAVRETAEELLLPAEQIEVIAPMHCMPGPGGAEVTSFLGVLHGYGGMFAASEVAEVFTIPLSWFAEHPPLIHSARMRLETEADFPYHLIPGGRNYPMRSIPRRFYFYETEHGVIWGMTAELLYYFLKENHA
ncbi:MAG: CoA pyrophosphatase [Eubacterium sp.]|nr:CoA pyrophosphatase [Eubacterium sp.]MBR0396681.1 CoA pyrophosphatase [Eubacterium sp.]